MKVDDGLDGYFLYFVFVHGKCSSVHITEFELFGGGISLASLDGSKMMLHRPLSKHKAHRR